MSVKLLTNFDFLVNKPLDVRDEYATLDDLRNTTREAVNEGHISFCLEDKRYYSFQPDKATLSATKFWHPLVESLQTDIDESFITQEELEEVLGQQKNEILEQITFQDTLSSQIFIENINSHEKFELSENSTVVIPVKNQTEKFTIKIHSNTYKSLSVNANNSKTYYIRQPWDDRPTSYTPSVTLSTSEVSSTSFLSLTTESSIYKEYTINYRKSECYLNTPCSFSATLLNNTIKTFNIIFNKAFYFANCSCLLSTISPVGIQSYTLNTFDSAVLTDFNTSLKERSQQSDNNASRVEGLTKLIAPNILRFFPILNNSKKYFNVYSFSDNFSESNILSIKDPNGFNIKDDFIFEETSSSMPNITIAPFMAPITTLKTYRVTHKYPLTFRVDLKNNLYFDFEFAPLIS